jgi:hypothetical protein
MKMYSLAARLRRPQRAGAGLWYVASTLALAVLAASALLYSTVLGIGVSPDSVSYLGAAESLLSGNGLEYEHAPSTHFPPLYPILLAMAAAVSRTDALGAARWLHAILLGLNLVLITVLAYQASGGSRLFTLVGSAFLLTSPLVLGLHAMAWSEAPFLLLCSLVVIILIQQLTAPSALTSAAAGIIIGTAVLTRYMGLALIPGAVAAILLLEHRPPGIRILHSAALGVPGLLPVTVWLAINQEGGQSSFAGRVLAFHPIAPDVGARFLAVAYESWIPRTSNLPSFVGTVLCGVLFGFLLGGLLLAAKDSGRPAAPGLPRLTRAVVGLLVLSYVASLITAISLFDAHTPIDTRTLAPASIFAFILIISASWEVSRNSATGFFRLALPSLLLLVVAANARGFLGTARQLHDEGSGYTGLEWRASETMACVASLPANWALYSNGPDAIAFLTDRPARWLPSRRATDTLLPNPAFRSQLAAVRAELRSQHAALVLFDGLAFRTYLADYEETTQGIEAMRVIDLQDGAIYSLGPLQCPGGSP